ncbi:MAG: hypothetical protein ABIH42_08665 [Planctomycetota bacterium]
MLNISERYKQWINAKRKLTRSTSNRASGFHPYCVRYMYEQRTNWDKAELPDIELQSIFKLGNDFERLALEELSFLGFSCVHQQKDLFNEQYNISGHPDVYIEIDKKLIPCDIKSISGNIFVLLQENDVESIITQNSWYYEKWINQILLYAWMSEAEYGLLLVKSKQNGLYKEYEVNVANNETRLNKLLEIANIINLAVEQKTPPPTIDNIDVCIRCEYFDRSCFPCLQYSDNAIFVQDKELLDLLWLRYLLEDEGRAFNKYDARIKELLKVKHPEICTIIIDDEFIIERKEFGKDRTKIEITKI